MIYQCIKWFIVNYRVPTVAFFFLIAAQIYCNVMEQELDLNYPAATQGEPLLHNLFVCVLFFQLAAFPALFPASRGLSRRDKLRGERPLPASAEYLITHASRFLNNQWRLCHVWHNPENWFEFEREHERLLNLSACSNFKWTNQSWRWNDLASGRCCGPHYKSLRKAEEANFKANFSFFWPVKHTYLEWNLLGFMELLVLLRFGTFLFEEKAISRLWSDV